MHILSIVTVNYKTDDFLKLLMESAERFTSIPYELIVIDNSENNIGHGEGLNKGAAMATGTYTMFVDSDCHFLRYGWEQYFLGHISQHDVIAGRGVPQKPIRPACMCLRTEIAQKYDWSATLGYRGHRITPEGYDVAIQAYHEMVKDKVNIKFIESRPSHYGTLNGEDWVIDNLSLVYHHWSSSWLAARQKDFPNNDLFADKELLFSKIPWRML